MKFLLTERQSAYIASANLETGKNKNERRVFFNGKREDDASIYGMPCGANCAITIIEVSGDESAGSLTFSIVPLPVTFIEIEIDLAVPTTVFQQLIDMDVDETTTWLNLAMINCTPEQQVVENQIGYADVSSFRLSFMLTANTIFQSHSKSIKNAKTVQDFNRRLDRLLWGIIIIGALILNILWLQHQ